MRILALVKVKKYQCVRDSAMFSHGSILEIALYPRNSRRLGRPIEKYLEVRSL